MHSLTSRVYAIASHAGTVLFVCAVLCAATAPLLFDTSGAHASATATVHSVTLEREYRDRVDYARVTLDIAADLSPLFHWHTKHVFFAVVAEYTSPSPSSPGALVRNEITLWDRVLASAADAKFVAKGEHVEYPLVDVGTSLRGANVTIVPIWRPVSTTGLLPSFRGTPTTVLIPTAYTSPSFS